MQPYAEGGITRDFYRSFALCEYLSMKAISRPIETLSDANMIMVKDPYLFDDFF